MSGVERVLNAARQIEAAAKGYKTQAACKAAITRITRLWEKMGSYGCVKSEVDDAIWECRIRWMDIAEDKRNAAAAAA